MLCGLVKIRNVFLSLRTLTDLVQNPAVSEIIDTRDIRQDEAVDSKFVRKSVLEDCDEDISHIAPYLKPTFNFAAYADKSEIIQQFVKLGVELHKWEKKPDVLPYILKLNFEKDIQKYLLFLGDVGVAADEFPRFLTRNPYIFKEDLENLLVRINYLKSKRFSNDMITRIITKNPYWLLFSTQRIDERLGFFQSSFGLKGNEVRNLTAHQPKIITYNIKHIKLNTFALKEEMGFTPDETKSILMKKPDIFMKAQDNLLKTFEFLHRDMKIPLERIVEFPGALTCRPFKIKQRHLFLKELDKAQYNAKEPNYVSLSALVSKTDAEFCSEVAKSSIQAFNTFLKCE